jgi:hypothetical protein
LELVTFSSALPEPQTTNPKRRHFAPVVVTDNAKSRVVKMKKPVHETVAAAASLSEFS